MAKIWWGKLRYQDSKDFFQSKDLDELSLQASFFNVSFPLYMRQTHVLHAPRFQSIMLSFCKLWSFQGVQHGVQHVEAVPHTRGEGWGRLPLRQLGNTQVGVSVQQVDGNMSRVFCKTITKKCVVLPTQGMKQFDKSCKFLQSRFLLKRFTHQANADVLKGITLAVSWSTTLFAKSLSSQAFTVGIMCLLTFSLLMWEETKMLHSW